MYHVQFGDPDHLGRHPRIVDQDIDAAKPLWGSICRHGKREASRFIPSILWIVPSWILPGDRRMVLLWGVRGQRIYVDPRSKLVMVNAAVHKRPVDLPTLREMDALWTALVRQLGG